MFETIDYIMKGLIDCDEMMKEVDMKQMAIEERSKLIDEIDRLEEDIIDILIPRSKADESNCTLEIKHAMGGSESSLFAEDLMKMY